MGLAFFDSLKVLKHSKAKANQFDFVYKFFFPFYVEFPIQSLSVGGIRTRISTVIIHLKILTYTTCPWRCRIKA